MINFLIAHCIFSFTLTALVAGGQTYVQMSESSEFVSEFEKIVWNSKEIFVLFLRSIEESKDYSTLYSIIYKFGVKLKSDDPNEFAKTISDSYSAVLDIMTPLLKGKIVAASIERLLNDYGIMTTLNACELSKQLANDLENTARAIGSMPRPGDSLKAVTVGMAKFISRHIIITSEVIRAFSIYFSEECNALNYYEYL